MCSAEWDCIAVFVFCAIQSDTVGPCECCVQCRVRLWGGVCVVCSVKCDCNAMCVCVHYRVRL